MDIDVIDLLPSNLPMLINDNLNLPWDFIRSLNEQHCMI